MGPGQHQQRRWHFCAGGLLLVCCARGPAPDPKSAPRSNAVNPASPAETVGKRRWLLWGTPQRAEARALLVPGPARQTQRFALAGTPEWSGDGSLFAACGAGELALFRVGDQGPVAMNQPAGPCFHMSWAPSGRELIVRRDELGTAWSWFGDAAQPAQVVELTTLGGPHSRRRPSWSADQSHLSLHNHWDTGEIVRLPQNGQTLSVTPPPPLPSERWKNCAWSPAGNKLACFVRGFKQVNKRRINDGFAIVLRDLDLPPDQPAVEVERLATNQQPTRLAWAGPNFIVYGLPARIDPRSGTRDAHGGSLNVVRAEANQTSTLIEPSVHVWEVAPGRSPRLAYLGDCPGGHGACLVELDNAGPTSERLLARGDFWSLEWSRSGQRLLIRNPGTLLLVEDVASPKAQARRIARVPSNTRIDGKFSPDGTWVEMATKPMNYRLDTPPPARFEPPPPRTAGLWHVPTRSRVELNSRDVQVLKLFWAPDDSAFVSLSVSRDSRDLSLVQIQGSKLGTPQLLESARDLYDVWVVWQPRRAH